MAQDFYKDLFESTRCGILAIDVAGRVLKVNRLARSILDLPEDPCEKMTCQDLLRDYPALCRILVESLKTENPPGRIELDLAAPDGPRRVIGGTVSHIRGSDGGRTGAALFFRDLTDLEGKEEQERLKERLEALGQMAAGLAHEIRNPLGNIGSTASLLKRKLSANDSGVLKLDSIIQEVGRLNQTVTQCLEYARPVHIGRQAVDVVEILRESVREVQGSRPGSRVRIEERLDGRVRPFAGDGIRLRQVFQNLITNAFDAMEGKGILEISLDLHAAEAPLHRGPGEGDLRPAEVVIRFRDNGPGVPAELRERLFAPFFTTKPGGSGMGLAVARKIVESHQGVLDAETGPGRGAVFVLKLPYQEWREEEPAAGEVT